MKITVFGATGGTGQHVVRKALEQGHDVTAYVRTPAKMRLDHDQLTLVQGQIDDGDTVATAIAGADAVISTLGAVRGGPPEVMVPAATQILAGMQAHGVKRLIWTSGAGVPDPHDAPALMNKVIGFLLKLTARKVLEDSIAGIEMVRASDTDWTIARGPMLTDAPGTGSYRAGYVNADMGRTLSRENFANFILQQLESDEWLHKMPAISDKS